jgi:hypothetical protein
MGQWRVGNHQPRNIYYDNHFVAVTLGCDTQAAVQAAGICTILNDQGIDVFKKKIKLGDVVLYRLSAYDVDIIQRIRDTKGAKGYQANDVHAGQVFPAQVVRTFDTGDTGTVDDNTGTVNLQVNLDGDDTYWATSRQIGDVDGSYSVD